MFIKSCDPVAVAATLFESQPNYFDPATYSHLPEYIDIGDGDYLLNKQYWSMFRQLEKLDEKSELEDVLRILAGFAVMSKCNNYYVHYCEDAIDMFISHFSRCGIEFERGKYITRRSGVRNIEFVSLYNDAVNAGICMFFVARAA